MKVYLLLAVFCVAFGTYLVSAAPVGPSAAGNYILDKWLVNNTKWRQLTAKEKKGFSFDVSYYATGDKKNLTFDMKVGEGKANGIAYYDGQYWEGSFKRIEAAVTTFYKQEMIRLRDLVFDSLWFVYTVKESGQDLLVLHGFFQNKTYAEDNKVYLRK